MEKITPTLRQRLLDHERLLGTILSVPSMAVPEIMAFAGYDWLFIDGEHAPLGASEIALLVQAAGPNLPCLVRVPDHGDGSIKNILDCGPAGIIAPMVNTASQAENIVAACKYPPQGRRSVGVGRAHTYGLNFKDYFQRANHETVVVVQVEHYQSVQNIESIIAVPGVDCAFIGPYDLSTSLGKPGEMDAPIVVEAVERVKQACKAAGKPLGMFSLDASVLAGYGRQGFSLLALGLDTFFLGNKAIEEREKCLRELE